VEVTARKAIFYNGKFNINEVHRTLEENNFDMALVQANVGLPPAEAITLADLKNPDDSAIFDARVRRAASIGRACGCGSTASGS
jgi:hypothetical protein